jgi:hypothetical protein
MKTSTVLQHRRLLEMALGRWRARQRRARTRAAAVEAAARVETIRGLLRALRRGKADG